MLRIESTLWDRDGGGTNQLDAANIDNKTRCKAKGGQFGKLRRSDVRSYLLSYLWRHYEDLAGASTEIYVSIRLYVLSIRTHIRTLPALCSRLIIIGRLIGFSISSYVVDLASRPAAFLPARCASRPAIRVEGAPLFVCYASYYIRS